MYWPTVPGPLYYVPGPSNVVPFHRYRNSKTLLSPKRSYIGGPGIAYMAHDPGIYPMGNWAARVASRQPRWQPRPTEAWHAEEVRVRGQRHLDTLLPYRLKPHGSSDGRKMNS